MTELGDWSGVDIPICQLVIPIGEGSPRELGLGDWGDWKDGNKRLEIRV